MIHRSSWTRRGGGHDTRARRNLYAANLLSRDALWLGYGRRSGLGCELFLSGVALADFAGGNPNQRDECDGDEHNGGPALELRDFSIEQPEANENEEEVRAEDLQRGFAEREERLARNDFDYVSAQEIENHGEANEVDDAEPADLPLVELKAERLWREVRAEPAEADSNEEETNYEANAPDPAGNFPEGESSLGEPGSKPEADGPDGLPGEEIEGSGFLKRDVGVGGVLGEAVASG